MYLPLLQASGGTVVTPATFGDAIAGRLPGRIFDLAPGYYLKEGGWAATAIGTAANPYVFRGQPGVIIGPIMISGPYITFEDCEFAYLGWTSRWSDTPGSNPPGLFYWARFGTWGKATIIRRCIIHDVGDVGWGVGASDSLFEDCLIYNIGWESTDRGHGHGVYIQNDTSGPKTMRRCVSLLCYATPGKIYGFNGQLENVTIEDSVLALGREGATYVRSDNSAAHGITLRNIWSYGVAWDHSNAAVGGGPLTVDGGVIVSDVDWYPYINLKNWQAGASIHHLQIVGRRAVVFWQGQMPLPFMDENTYNVIPPSVENAPFGTFANGGGAAYRTLAAWQAGTGNDINSTYATTLPAQPRIEVIPRARDKVVVVYNWNRAPAIVPPIPGVYTNAMNRSERAIVGEGCALLPMTGWTVSPPLGATAPLYPWNPQFGVFLVT